ncbi:MAG: hypothetical protein PUD70_04165 [Firmicutes bacterium]|nr:hypothetical protein [Clostridiales bacterium]MDD5883263.1 hypothetical protein [Bacillota bacterium]
MRTKTDQTFRNTELDTIKLFAALLVYTTHFISHFQPEYFKYWITFPTKAVLCGITGKLGVAFFGVLLGYFAYIGESKRSLIAYTLKRYGYFVFVGLFVNTLYCVWLKRPLFSAVPESLRIGADLFPGYWCMQEFLFASIIACYIKRDNWSFEKKAFLILLLFLIGQVWVPICLLGTLLPELVESAYFKNKPFRLLLLIISFFSIQRPENTLTYILDGFFAVIVICIVENSEKAKKVLSNKVTASLGKRSMAIYVIHTLTYSIVGQRLFDHFLRDSGFEFVLGWGICFLIICALSYPLTSFFNLYNKLFEGAYAYCRRKFPSNDRLEQPRQKS